ncbi:Uncharacterised protein [Mycobacteroides abscessus subsp. abscessus]|nr:Uncharacterised protein [Mycobacteroides abscessus subsp. abscessus]
MNPVTAKRKMRVGVALDIERKGVVEHVLVEIGRGIEHSDALVLADLYAAQFDIL